MLSIEKKGSASEMTVALGGRLDTTTAPQLEKALSQELDGVTALTFDMEALEYISSAGLRVLMTAQKTMAAAGGKVLVASPNDMVRGVLDMTGLSGVLEIA